MDISIYSSYFHDGSIIDIKHAGDRIEISMHSAEVHEEDLQAPITLSKYHRIKGKLHLEGIKYVKDNNEILHGVLKMLYDGAGILHLEVAKNRIKLDLNWVNYPPHPDITAYSFYEIGAKKIWWENIPDLKDPVW